MDANLLPTNHGAKHQPERLMIILINPQDFMHGRYSSNLLILDRNLFKPVERMKRQNPVSVFTLVDIKVGRFDNSKSDLFANSNITLSWGNIILLNASLVSSLNNDLKLHVSRACLRLERMEFPFLLYKEHILCKEVAPNLFGVRNYLENLIKKSWTLS